MNADIEKTSFDIPGKFKFKMDFPRATNYSDFNEIVKAFPHLKYVNSPTFDTEQVRYGDFYVIKSTNDDDIHKAIKYGIWTSKTINNIRFSESFRNKKQVFLIFSVARSEQFLGVAKMTVEFSKNDSFKFWWEGCKWFGIFKIEWVFIKDIKQKFFDFLEIDQLKDGSQLNFDEGKWILSIFQQYKGKGSIFSAFDLMDEREDGLRYSRENDEIFKKQFEELSKSYSQNPHSLRKVSFPKPYQQYNSNSYNNMYPNYYQYPYYNSNYDYDYPQKNNYYSPYQQQRDDYYKPKYNSNAEPFFYQEKNQKYEEEEEEEKR